MKRIGIIGVGEIGRAIVTGLRHGGDEFPEVFLSPRGARTATELSACYEGVQVCADNQEVVDRSELVIIAVRREGRHDALAGVRVDDGKIVVNVMAGVGNDDLRQTLATGAPLVRAIPLPAIRERRSVTVVYPAHSEVNSLFERPGRGPPRRGRGRFQRLLRADGDADHPLLVPRHAHVVGRRPRHRLRGRGPLRSRPLPGRRSRAER